MQAEFNSKRGKIVYIFMSAKHEWKSHNGNEFYKQRLKHLIFCLLHFIGLGTCFVETVEAAYVRYKLWRHKSLSFSHGENNNFDILIVWK